MGELRITTHTAGPIDSSTCGQDSSSVVFAVLLAQVTSDKWLLYNFTMCDISVLIFIANQHDSGAFSALIRREHRDFISQRHPRWTPLVFSLKSARHALHFSCLPACRTQKMGFSRMWTSRCPWCAVSWLGTPSWREDITPWASPRGDNFCM